MLNGLTVIQQSNSSVSQSRNMDSAMGRKSFTRHEPVPLLEVPQKKRDTLCLQFKVRYHIEYMV